MTDKLPVVALFGRTNVGKSTLFNCLRETRQALVSATAGTTRDTNAGTVSWRNRRFTLIDTGGVTDPHSRRQRRPGDDIDSLVQGQARRALGRADFILFLVDAQSGPTADDRALARNVRQFPGRVFLVMNKADNPRLRARAAEFMGLGLGEPFAVSAASGAGTGDMLDSLVDALPETKEPDEPKLSARVAIVGAPNVGKSSLLNAFFHEPRVIVSAVPHTTREPHDELLIYRDQPILLIDTAGITRAGRKSARIASTKADLGRQSIRRSLSAIDRADVVLLVLDATAATTREDGQLAAHILAAKKSLILVLNKWDLAVPRTPSLAKANIYGRLPSLYWAPVAFVSAKTGEKTTKLLDQVLSVAAARQRSVSDSLLDRFLRAAVKHRLPTRGRGTRFPYLRHLTQITVEPPTFAVHLKEDLSVDDAYLTFLANRLRDEFGYEGTPVTLYVEKRRKKNHTT